MMGKGIKVLRSIIAYSHSGVVPAEFGLGIRGLERRENSRRRNRDGSTQHRASITRQEERITDEGAWGALADTFSRLGDGNSFFFFFLVPRWAARRIISVAVVESCTLLGVAKVIEITKHTHAITENIHMR